MLYFILEKAINHILQLDPDTLKRLEKLQGKVVKITFTDWKLDCYIVIQQDGVKLVREYSGLVDTTISGKLSGMIRASCSGINSPALLEQGIQVTGDSELGEQIRDILRRVDLDGEEYLSRFVGDATAHEIGWRAKRAVDLGKQTWRDLWGNIREFCQVEAQYLPTRSQVENFYSQIVTLRDGVDRAAARLQRLEQKITNGSKKPD